VSVKVGDKIAVNQVIARIAQPALLEKLRLVKQDLSQARTERDWAVRVAEDSSKLQAAAIRNQSANADREITELQAQADFAKEQIPVVDQLLEKGLVTKEQTIAAREKLASIEAQIASRRALLKQYEAQQFTVRAQPQQIYTEKQEHVRAVELSLANMEKELTLAENVVSPYSGEVIEMKADAGSVVAPDAPIVSIQPDVDNLEVLVYLPSLFAKNVSSQMEAEISPSMAKREEFGFIRGKVVYVANYPATPASLTRNFHNETLSNALTSAGPVTELRVWMRHDTASPSGFLWSSSQGPDLPISSGSICSVDIITRVQKPISLLLPYIKKGLGWT
jgi:HlyD family secretion protein